jgi:hypothetical protein
MKLSSPLKLMAVACLAAVAVATFAQTKPTKTVAVEPTGIPVAAGAQGANANASGSNVFIVFGQWVDGLSVPALTVVQSEPVVPVAFGSFANAAAEPFQAAPVILGQPEIPLLGQAAADAGHVWNTGFNYQGLQLSYLVLNANGTRHEVRQVGKGLAAGERFKIRYTASFDAVAVIDKVVGDVWNSQRVGQAWPQAGMSAASQAGETVELPIGGGYFVMSGSSTERYVLSVRHPNAKGTERSDQPIYRQDGARGSSYVQLVPGGKWPNVEQVISARVPN